MTSSVPPLVRRRPSRISWRATAIALVSSVVVIGGLAVIVVNAPGWPEVQKAFFNGPIFWESLPGLIGAFVKNIQLFLIAEILILPIGLALAVLRVLPGPVFLPVRALATAYVDVFRAIPGLVVIYLLGIGVPTLGLPGVPSDLFFWGIIALTLVYSAYVSEVYRAGIQSVHPSQDAAARSLGLSRFQSMRYVVVPQAIRRVIPPLLNDFIGLQKDTVLISFIGIVEIFRYAQIQESALFNFTPIVGVALVFIVVTIPLARLVDWLVARDQRQRATQGAR